jgi:factor associated with neutral sphingomyelinase activation
MLKRRKNNKRFNLLLLQENEIYYNDFAATLFTSKTARMKYSGRLHLCSHSLIFVPEEAKIPIMYLDYTKMDQDASLVPFNPPKSYEYAFKPFNTDSLFSIKIDQVTEMKKLNKHHPYIVKKEETELIFGITFITASEFINKVKPIFQVWRNIQSVSKFSIIDRVKRNYQSQQSQFTFDVTWLEDFREQQLYETNGVRVTPLVDTPGRFLLTNSRIYFQPFNNISSKPVKKYQLKNIVRVVKRRHVLKHVGIEIYLKKNSSIFFSFNSYVLLLDSCILY